MGRLGKGAIAAVGGLALAAITTIGTVRATPPNPTTLTGDYVTPATVITGCLTVQGTQHCTGGAAFDVSSVPVDSVTQLATLSSITIQDQALTGVDGDWTINDNPQLGNSVLSGFVCNGKFVSDPANPTTFTPTAGYTLFVNVAAPGDSVTGCANAGTPTATAGTITVVLQ